MVGKQWRAISKRSWESLLIFRAFKDCQQWSFGNDDIFPDVSLLAFTLFNFYMWAKVFVLQSVQMAIISMYNTTPDIESRLNCLKTVARIEGRYALLEYSRVKWIRTDLGNIHLVFRVTWKVWNVDALRASNSHLLHDSMSHIPVHLGSYCSKGDGSKEFGLILRSMSEVVGEGTSQWKVGELPSLGPASYGWLQNPKILDHTYSSRR